MRLKEIVIIFFLIHMLNANTQEISENTFLFCIKPNIQPLEINREDGELIVNILEINNIFREHGVADVQPWIKNATEIDRDGDIYLNRIYRVYLQEERIVSKEQKMIFIYKMDLHVLIRMRRV